MDREAALVAKLVRELNGIGYIYDSYLYSAFKKIAANEDLTGIDPEIVKRRALRILGFK